MPAIWAGPCRCLWVLLGAVTLLAIGVGSVANAQEEPEEPVVALAEAPALGAFLTSPDGITLYRFDLDAPDESNCVDSCNALWPPHVITGDPVAPADLAGTLAVIARADGTLQVTHDGWPLYRFVEDENPGEVYGHGVDDVWWAATIEETSDDALEEPPAQASPAPAPVAPTPTVPVATPTATPRPTPTATPTVTPVPIPRYSY